MRAALLWDIFSVEVRKRMSYRADFWINSLVGILVQLSVFWFLTYAMFSASGQPTLGGYTERGMILYYVFVTLTGRIVHSNDLDMGISQDIYEGSLTRYLIYPVSYRAVKYAEQLGAIAPQLIQLTLFGFLAPLVVGIPDEVVITPASVAMALIALALANLLHYLLVIPIQAVAFWADNVWSLVIAKGLIFSFLGGMIAPISLFPEWAQSLLVWLPFPYLYSFPARTLMGRVSFADWAIGLLVAAAWCLVAAALGRWIWRRGELEYTGVGI
jgi:viologen exporter family transport system permease protein